MNPESDPLQSSFATTKKRSLAYVRNAGLTLFIFFLVAALMNVSILWLEVAIASKRFKRIKSPQLSLRYRYGVAIFDVLVAALVAIINWYNAALTGLIGVVLFSLIVALYSYSAIAIYFLLKNQGSELNGKATSSKSSDIIKQSLIKIRKCAQWVIVFLGFWVILMLFISRKHPLIRFTVAFTGQIVDVMACVDIGFLSALIASWGVINYLKKTGGSSDQIQNEMDIRNLESVDTSGKDKAIVASRFGTANKEHSAVVVAVDTKESN